VIDLWYRSGIRKVVELSVPSDSTLVTFYGLNILKHRFYLIIFSVKNTSSSSSDYYLFVNGDLNKANYYCQTLVSSGVTIGANRYNYPLVAYLSSLSNALCEIILGLDPDFHPRYHVRCTRNVSNVDNALYSGSYYAPVSNVTRLDLQSSATNAIGSGSRIIIFGAMV
jgi:hypothetical protein